MNYVLGQTSLARLETVEPALAGVVRYAITITSQDFMVLEGVRSREQMMVNYGKGRTAQECLAKGVPALYGRPDLAKVTWLRDPFNSPHRAQGLKGLSRAVDLVTYPVDWNNLAGFNAIAEAMFHAARILAVKIRWGADWDSDGNPRERGERDSPHFELVP